MEKKLEYQEQELVNLKKVTLKFKISNSSHSLPSLEQQKTQIEEDIKNQKQILVLKEEGYPEKTLLFVKKYIKIKIIRKRMKNMIEKLKEHESVNPQRIRMKTIKQIIESEKVYFESLKTLLNSFYRPLLNECEKVKPIITRQEIRDIFSNIEIIYEITQNYLNDLKNRVAEKTFRFNIFGDIFLRLVPILKIYSFYIRNYEKGQQ